MLAQLGWEGVCLPSWDGKGRGAAQLGCTGTVDVCPTGMYREWGCLPRWDVHRGDCLPRWDVQESGDVCPFGMYREWGCFPNWDVQERGDVSPNGLYRKGGGGCPIGMYSAGQIRQIQNCFQCQSAMMVVSLMRTKGTGGGGGGGEGNLLILSRETSILPTFFFKICNCLGTFCVGSLENHTGLTSFASAPRDQLFSPVSPPDENTELNVSLRCSQAKLAIPAAQTIADECHSQNPLT